MTDEQIDQIIDAVRNALGGMMPRSTNYAEHREQAARGIRAALAQHPNQSDYEAVLADHKRLVRELDVLLNGEAGAAQQASLVDLVAQFRRQGIRAALPSQSAGEPVAYLTMARDGLVRCARTSAPTREERAVADSDGDVIIPVYASPPPTTALPQGFLADVMTAAGLVAHGKQSKALSERLGQAVMSIRLLPPLPSTAHHAARVEADRRDAQRLDWLDATNARFKMGWDVGVAPAGNVSVKSVIQLGRTPTSIRDAIDAALAAERKEQA